MSFDLGRWKRWVPRGKEANALPSKALTAGIPVNVRPADDQGTGNAISFIMANLGTDIADPLKRLEAIKESTERAKAHLQSLPKAAMQQYTLIVMAPYILQLLTGAGGRAITPEVLEYSHARTPWPRLGRPLDVANAALFMASDEASFISGVHLRIDGAAGCRVG